MIFKDVILPNIKFVLLSNNIIRMNLCWLTFKTILNDSVIHYVWRQTAFLLPLTPIHFHFPVKPCIYTDNINKVLRELFEDVTVGWWSMYSCIIFFQAVVIHFVWLECTFLVRFVSVNNPILFISVQSNLLQIINSEKPVDLFYVV